MAVQKIRLSQIMANLEGATHFEDQLLKMRSNYEEYFVATAGQATFTVASDYAVGKSQLMVYVNGLRMKIGDDYTETNSRMFTFVSGLYVGDVVLVRLSGDPNVIVRNNPGMLNIHRQVYIIEAANSTQVQFTTSVPYKVGGNNLEVFRDGILQQPGATADYIEVDVNTFKFNNPLTLQTQVLAKITQW